MYVYYFMVYLARYTQEKIDINNDRNKILNQELIK